ncbi:MAG: PSD1 domain-containing protein [Verrucomicrobiae bacterium]|nr:PSD1 domain-containing protein [Verrucomicrobiae bacterium]
MIRFFSLNPIFAIPCLAFFSAIAVGAESPKGMEVSFRRDVRPILSDKCFSCHGPDAETREADLRLDTQEGAFGDLGGYAAVVPGDLEKSELIYRITTDESDDLMPPKKFHKPLKAAEVDILKKWVASGANWESHWAYTPLVRPETPKVEDSDFVRNDIDRFVLAAQKEKGLTHAPKADRVSLARRLYLDLTGLPPTPEQVDAFLADDSETAYQELVEQLLQSKHFGERMATFWLDLVRYADTIGYHSDTTMEVSAYRDYVIDAFNENLPYDRFTIEQLAGDLLPEPTVKQRVASGYNRLLQTTEEGGAQPKEYMAIHAADRVRNVSEVWLGSTMGCAQCHDHKFDPFTAKDFYRMAAFFADVKEKPIGKREPNLKLPTPAEDAEMASLKKNLEEKTVPKVLAADKALAEKVSETQKVWEAELLAQLADGKSEWQVIQPTALKSTGGQDLKTLPDGSVLTGGKKNPTTDVYSATLPVKGKVTGVRLEALTDDSLAKKSLSRGNGNFVMTHFAVTVGGKPVTISEAKADFEQEGYPVANAIDADPKSGWAGNGHNEAKNRAAMFLFAEPVDLGEAGELVVTMKHESGFGQHAIGRFRLSTTTSAAPTLTGGLDLPLDVQEALRITSAERNVKQQQLITAHFQSVSPDLAPHRKALADWKARLEAVEKGVQTMLVAESLPEPRVTRVLARGNWLDESGEIVEPAVPEFLRQEVIEGRRATRLDLAQWIVSGENPLTARTFANRVWKLYFGAGISTDLTDLGGQGKPPTDPALLDWLAVEFRDKGWDVKALVRLMVSSGAYQQSAIPTPEAKEADPANTWLTRQRRWRLPAEFVRDTALEVSGLLVKETIGGKSVKPYQPAGYWQHLNFPKREWQADSGEGLYRRGLYTFWCRTFPHPAMTAFDAPSREECAAERSRSNTPQQALVLLNDPQFVEASRVFAQHIVSQPADDAGKVAWAWKKATGRQPSAEEQGILANLFTQQQARYASDPESAKALVATGQFPVPDAQDPIALAAWTQVARTILNAYETTSRF